MSRPHAATSPASNPAGQPLFRAIAVQSSAGTQIGAPLTTHWRGVALFTLSAFVLIAALAAFAAMTEYSPVHRVPSYVDLRGGLVRLNAPISGHVRELAMEQGAFVRRGALLAILDSDRLRTDGGSEHSALRRGFEDERATIGREMGAAQHEADANEALIDRKLHGLHAERDALGVQIQASDVLLASLTAQSQQIDAVAEKGYVSKLQAAQKSDEVTSQHGRLAELHSTLARIDLEIATTEAERQVISAKLQGLVENQRRSSGEVDRQIVQIDSESQQAIRAPADGVLSMALIANGQSVAAGQPLFTIAPVDVPLIVRLLVPARAAGTVKAGLDVKVVFRAYPQEKFGHFDAHIETVSDMPSLPSELEHIYALSEPVFIAVASLPAELRTPDGRLLKIKAGMLADVLVPIERRTILQWLFEPLLHGFHASADPSRDTSTSAMGVK